MSEKLETVNVIFKNGVTTTSKMTLKEFKALQHVSFKDADYPHKGFIAENIRMPFLTEIILVERLTEVR